MTSLGPHAFFIAAAYGVTAVVVIGLVARAVVGHRLQARRLAEIDGRRVRRDPADRRTP